MMGESHRADRNTIFLIGNVDNVFFFNIVELRSWRNIFNMFLFVDFVGDPLRSNMGNVSNEMGFVQQTCGHSWSNNLFAEYTFIAVGCVLHSILRMHVKMSFEIHSDRNNTHDFECGAFG